MTGDHLCDNFILQIALVYKKIPKCREFNNNFKVHLTPKYFFRSNKSLHLFERHCTFLPLFNPNLDFLQAVKVTKSGHYLLHDRASKGMSLFLGRRHKLLCMHIYKDLIRFKSVCDIKQGIDPFPLLARSCDR